MNNSSEQRNNDSSKPMKDKTIQDFITELKTEERYTRYFEDFNPDSVKHFIETYSNRKLIWWQHGDFYVRHNENEDMQWINEAKDHLEIIQQKKLFDAQCLWRAEKVMYEEIKICFDFEVWEKGVLNCPFIEPINGDDIKLYSEYLLSDNVDFEEFFFKNSWQEYDEIIEAYKTDNGNRNFPEWYDFCNGRRGTGVLMSLPDIRGEKEKFYTSLHFASKRQEFQKAHEEAEARRDKRPSIYFSEPDQLEYFIKKYEDKQTQLYYKAYKRHNRTSDEEIELQEIIAILLKADEYVPIQANLDFREAIKKAFERYRAKKIAEFLPYAFDEYKLGRSMNFPPSEQDLKSMKDYASIRETWYHNIINGRVLNDEPPDLNF